MSAFGVHFMSNNIDLDRARYWRAEGAIAILKAGRVEKQLAEETGDYHQGVPAIAIIVHGVWSKRLDLCAKSGFGITFGQKTHMV